MGYKISMITVKQPNSNINNEELLKALGFTHIAFSGDTTFEECMYPSDKSINFGHYNNCFIITDDYQLTTSLELSKTSHLLSDYEKVLSELFPHTEILTIACHSAMNYHLYSLVKDGQKLRFKKISYDQPIVEYGERLEEEEGVYGNSKVIDGQRMFRSSFRDDQVYDNTEDQMMEDFAFGMAKRHLGVMISTAEDEALMFETPFKKYTVSKATTNKNEVESEQKTINQIKGSWLSKLFKKF